MSYTSDIPVSGDSLGGTRDRVRTNFQVIASTLAVNHVAFGGAAGEGKHNFLQMPDQASAPATAVNEAGFYAKAVSGVSNLFFRAEDSGGGGGFEYQMTRAISASTALFSANTAYGSPPAGFTQDGGWTFLPGGLILQYGFYGKASALGNTGTIQFPVTFTNPAYSVTGTLYRTGSGSTRYFSITTVPTTSGFTFQVDSGSSSDGIFWQAIGK